ncbi:hypothetical protein GCM10010411_76240 [Actinomadura fulvescens]|uniref:Uncharacterized protein n=1 Tax=Actinomadura fulvescens TaxID=46160 RepID=A0ABN3QJH9_9ACTN
MTPVVLLPDGRLRVPRAEHDPRVGGIAHTSVEIGPDHPDYPRLRPSAVPEAELVRRRESRAAEQAELDRYLSEHEAEGDAMLQLLQLQLTHRPAS